MRFNICLANLPYRDSVGDKVLLLKHGLSELGYIVFVSDLILDDCCNIFFEWFDDAFVETLRSRHSTARIVVIATEWITGSTFNDFSASTGSTYDRKDMWKARFDNFRRVASMAEAVWCLSPNQIDGYQRIVEAPVSYLPHGHVAAYCTSDTLPKSEKRIDFLFSGTLSDHRVRILDALENMGYAVIRFAPNTPAYLRLEMYRMARIALGLRMSGSWRFPSVSRIHYCLSHLVPHVMEEHPEQSDLDAYVRTAPPEGLLDCLRFVHAHADLESEALAAREKFRTGRPLAPILQTLVNGLRKK